MNSNATPPPPYSAPSRTSGLAIASLVLGILSFFFWIVTGLPAVICGHLSLSKIKKASGLIGGRGLAIAGLITGYVGLAIYALVFAVTINQLGSTRGIAKTMQVRADIQAIGTQLKLYESINGFLPTTEQGLQALVTQPSTEPKPTRWYQLFKEIPKDPWGNNYIYLSPGRRNPAGYDLYSAGPDRKADTADDDWGQQL